MPNHVINEIVVHGAKLEDVRAYLFGKDERLSFSVLLPLPLNFWSGSVSSKHKAAFPGNHLDAATEVWGTKWDAYGEPTAEQTQDDVTIQFQTAWGHPRGWVCALFNVVGLPITASWLSEGGFAAHVEKYTLTGAFGDIDWDDEEIKDGSPEYRRLHKLLWGVEEFEPED